MRRQPILGHMRDGAFPKEIITMNLYMLLHNDLASRLVNYVANHEFSQNVDFDVLMFIIKNNFNHQSTKYEQYTPLQLFMF